MAITEMQPTMCSTPSIARKSTMLMAGDRKERWSVLFPIIWNHLSLRMFCLASRPRMTISQIPC